MNKDISNNVDIPVVQLSFVSVSIPMFQAQIIPLNNKKNPLSVLIKSTQKE